MTNSSLIRFARFAFKGLKNPQVAFVEKEMCNVCTPVYPTATAFRNHIPEYTQIEIETVEMKANILPLRHGRRQFIWGYGPRSNTLFVWKDQDEAR